LMAEATKLDGVAPSAVCQLAGPKDRPTTIANQSWSVAMPAINRPDG